MSDLKPAMHGRDHCPGGSDPIPCLGTDVVHMFSWNYDTDNTVNDKTWTPVANFAGGGGFFESIFVKGSGWAYNANTGTVTVATTYEYVIHGWVQFNEDASDGEQRIVAVNFGASDRHIAIFPFVTDSGSIAQLKLPITTTRSTTLGTTSAQLEVWHNHGSDISIRDASFVVRRFESVSQGEVFDNDPFA